MCSLSRGVLLCLFIVVVTPRPAHAWFEWLDRFSGPGYWWGLKVDVRALCFGPEIPTMTRSTSSAEMIELLRQRSPVELERIRENLRKLREINDRLKVLDPTELDQLEARFATFGTAAAPTTLRFDPQTSKQDPETQFVERYRANEAKLLTAASFITAPGILISLCSSNRVRSFALELGTTWMGAFPNPEFANNHGIGLTTFTAGLTYRLPLPVNKDFFDLGTNVGVATFYSKGFHDFHTLTIEPFVDLHMPTNSRWSDSKAKRMLAPLTLRTSLIFFPKGFDAGAFGPSSPRFSGSEANPSLTVYYTLWFSKPTAPLPRPGA